MKILIYLIRMKGGVGRVVNNIKPILEKEGHEVTVIARDDFFSNTLFENALFNATLESRSKIRKIVKYSKYDILLTMDWSCALQLLGFKNHYCMFHGFELNPITKLFQKYVSLRIGKNLIVVSDKLKELYPKSTIAYNGVNFNEFKDLKIKRNKIGWVKRDYDSINEEEFLKICKDYYPELIPTIAEDIKPEEMNVWYNQLKIFVSFPPKYAGFNLCWLEAKASGVPIILGNENGIGIDKINEDGLTMTCENQVNSLPFIKTKKGFELWDLR